MTRLAIAWAGRLCRLTVAVLALGTTGYLQPSAVCDALRPDEGPLAYGPRQGRCEGMYVPAASGTIEIVSFHRGSLTAGLASGAPHVTLPATLRPLVTTPLRVRAVALPARTYYRMDGQLASATDVLRWPLDTVVRRVPLAETDLGIFGWYGEAEPVYVPLDVTADGAAAAPAATTELRVRIPFDSDAVLWRLSKTAGEPAAWTRAAGRLRQWSVVDLLVPSSTGGPEQVTIEVTAKLINSDDWDVLTLHVLQP